LSRTRAEISGDILTIAGFRDQSLQSAESWDESSDWRLGDEELSNIMYETNSRIGLYSRISGQFTNMSPIRDCVPNSRIGAEFTKAIENQFEFGWWNLGGA
jgi:hypothetical protein